MKNVWIIHLFAALVVRPFFLKYKDTLYMIQLTLKSPITTKGDDNFDFFFLISDENKSWYFMWIVCQEDDSHEISRLVFSEK